MYRFCPQCATELVVRRVDSRELPACPACGFVHYNNSRPCVGVFVLEAGRVLLAERADEPFRGYWDVPGGFLDSGESPEDAAARELREETGLEVELTEMLGFFTDTYGEGDIFTLSICYLARIVWGTPKPASDAVSLRWFPLHDVPERIAFQWVREALARLQARMKE